MQRHLHCWSPWIEQNADRRFREGNDLSPCMIFGDNFLADTLIYPDPECQKLFFALDALMPSNLSKLSMVHGPDLQHLLIDGFQLLESNIDQSACAHS